MLLRFAFASVLLLAAAPATRAQAPTWAVNPAAFEQSMSVIATVSVSGVRLSAPGDRLAAFVGGSVRGVATPTVVGGANMFFLSVYANVGGEPVTFKAYDAAANTVRDLSATLTFAANAVAGSVPAPLALTSGTTGGGGGGTPDPWRVTPSAFSRSMSLVGEIRYSNGDGAGASDIVAAFVGSEVRGVATPTEVGGRRVFFLTAFANTEGEALTFKLATGGAVRDVGATQTFAADAVAGTLLDPLAWTVSGSPAGGSDSPAAWTVNASGFDRSMNVVAALFTGGTRSVDPTDRVAAFVGSEVRGVASPQQVGGVWVAFLTVYGRVENEAVRFKVLDASSGAVIAVAGSQTFVTNAVLGSLGQPVVLAGQGGAGTPEDPRVWTVTPSSFEQSMNAVAEVRVAGVAASAAGTRVAAFVGGEVRGVAAVPSAGSPLVFLTVHGRPGDGSVSYKAFDAGTGRIYEAAQTRPFEANRVDGQPGAPLVIDAAPDPTSVFVYPGDADGDGRVSQNDLFPLSFYFGLLGPVRAGAGVQFRPELAAAWSPSAASTADMNGDGRINQNDLFPLGFNFGRTRAAGAFFSATPEPSSAPRLSAAGTSAGSSAGVLVGTPSSSNLRVGDTLRVAVRIAGAGAVRAVGFQVRYDASVFEPLGRVRGALFAGALAGGEALELAKLETGRLSYAATLTGAGSVGDGEVVVVRLRVRAGASGDATLTFGAPEAMAGSGAAIALTAAPVVVRVGATTSAEGAGSIEPVALSAPAPNPARGSALVRVRLAAPGHVRVTLSDVTGRTIAIAFDGALAPGAVQSISLDTSSLASGLYLVRATTPQGTATRTLVVRH